MNSTDGEVRRFDLVIVGGGITLLAGVGKASRWRTTRDPAPPVMSFAIG